MMRRFATPIALAMGLSLSACANMAQNQSMNSIHQPLVERSNYALDLNVTPGGGLPLSEQRRLTEWFDAMGLTYGDRVSVDDPAANRGAKSMVEAAASRNGILVSDNAPVTAGRIAPGTMRVVVTRTTAFVPGCPNWKTTSDINFKNGISSNYGCATNSNVAAMVADPEDLVNGRDVAGGSDPATAGKAIKSYREAEPSGKSGLPASSTQSGSGGGN